MVPYRRTTCSSSSSRRLLGRKNLVISIATGVYQVDTGAYKVDTRRCPCDNSIFQVGEIFPLILANIDIVANSEDKAKQHMLFTPEIWIGVSFIVSQLQYLDTRQIEENLGVSNNSDGAWTGQVLYCVYVRFLFWHL